MNIVDKQNFVAQFVQLLKSCLCNMWLGIVMENWALSVGQCWLQALQFSVQIFNLLSILLRCNGFARIQKAVVDQLGASLALGSALELLLGPATELVIAVCHIQSTFHCTSQSDREIVVS